jgi:hypothetical protein
MPRLDFFENDRFRAAVMRLADVCSPQALYGHIAEIERSLLCRNHEDGDLTGVEDWRIEAAAAWAGPPGRLLAALQEAGLIYQDQAGSVRWRGWPEHAPEHVQARHRMRRVRKCSNSSEQFRNVAPEESRGEKRREKKRQSWSDSAVDSIYQTYPRHVGAKQAKIEIRAALDRLAGRNGCDPIPWLTERVQLYADACRGREQKYILHPERWFKRERYDDDPAAWKSGSGPKAFDDRPGVLQEEIEIPDALERFGRKDGET